MNYAIYTVIPVLCLLVVCVLLIKENRHLIDLLSTRNPDSVIFDNKPEKRGLRNPYKKRERTEELKNGSDE